MIIGNLLLILGTSGTLALAGELVYGQQNEKARHQLSDNELLSLFNKTQQLSDDQKKTVMDLLSTFLLKANLAKQLS